MEYKVRKIRLSETQTIIDIFKLLGMNPSKELLDLLTPYWKKYAEEKNVTPSFEKVLEIYSYTRISPGVQLFG